MEVHRKAAGTEPQCKPKRQWNPTKRGIVTWLAALLLVALPLSFAARAIESHRDGGRAAIHAPPTADPFRLIPNGSAPLRSQNVAATATSHPGGAMRNWRIAAPEQSERSFVQLGGYELTANLLADEMGVFAPIDTVIEVAVDADYHFAFNPRIASDK